jgi:uncharacterized protein YndB with AHSA1/START domain/DNA-binding transcriptional ArsR family regulator
MEEVFKALADRSRRHLLDRLRERDGQTLGELAAGLAMARQSASQHLSVLQSANLISVVWQGRLKLHYLNPVPLHEMQERWIDRFAPPRLHALSLVKQHAEEDLMTNNPAVEDSAPDRPTFSYTTYIKATAERVWQALTDAETTAAYWGHANRSDWKVGSGWTHERTDGSGIADVIGTVLESDPPRRLTITFAAPQQERAGDPSIVTFVIEPFQDIVKLTVTHTGIPGQDDLEAAAIGWASVFANLKTLLETGSVLPQAPWEMHAELRDAHMASNDR